MKSILQDWVMELGLRHQGVLVSAIRGCDSVSKDDPSKWLIRYYRGCILNPHCGDLKKASSFMVAEDDFTIVGRKMRVVTSSHDHYPNHFLMHLLQAAEVLGYKHPDTFMRTCWHMFYSDMVKKFHLNMETEQQMDERLNASEEEFAAKQ